MAFKFNPLTGEFDLVGQTPPSPLPTSVKLTYAINQLAAYDRVASVVFADAGNQFKRIVSATYTSALFPLSDVVKSISYLDVGTMNQRVDVIDYTGTVFGSDVLRKRFFYNQTGIRYELSGFEYELI